MTAAPANSPEQAPPVTPAFDRRVVGPVGAALLAAIVLYILNSLPLPVENRGLYQLLKNTFLILFYAQIWLSSALFVYPALYRAGASLGLRILASLVVPVGYILSEIVRVTAYFSLGEALYYGLSTMGLLTLALQVGLLGAAEMACRGRARAQTGRPQRVVSLGPVLAVLFMLGAIYVLVLWGMGVHWFYIYQEGYKALFAR